MKACRLRLEVANRDSLTKSPPQSPHDAKSNPNKIHKVNYQI